MLKIHSSMHSRDAICIVNGFEIPKNFRLRRAMFKKQWVCLRTKISLRDTLVLSLCWCMYDVLYYYAQPTAQSDRFSAQLDAQPTAQSDRFSAQLKYQSNVSQAVWYNSDVDLLRSGRHQTFFLISDFIFSMCFPKISLHKKQPVIFQT